MNLHIAIQLGEGASDWMAPVVEPEWPSMQRVLLADLKELMHWYRHLPPAKGNQHKLAIMTKIMERIEELKYEEVCHGGTQAAVA